MKLPCIDCITYPICRVDYLDKMKSYEGDTDLKGSRNHLMVKCSLLKDWVDYIKKFETSYNDFHEHFYFNPPGKKRYDHK